jgi:hypothetical protein
MSGDDKDTVFVQEGYSGGVYSPEGYRPSNVRKSNKSTAGHQPMTDKPPQEVISVKTQPKNPPTGR